MTPATFWRRGSSVALTYGLSRALIALVGGALMITQGWTFSVLVNRWDVDHFIGIAKDGYADPSSAAFFPGLPLLLKAGAVIGVPLAVTGVLLALIGSALAAAALFRLFGAPAACLWLIAPTAIFTVVGYSEAPFCAAAFWAWQKASERKWGQAALLAGLACTFRITGVFLLAALAVYALVQHSGGPRLVVKWAWLLVPVAVLGAFTVYLHQVTGSWMAWWDAQQSGWGRALTTPWQSLWHTIQAGAMAAWPGRPDVAWVFRAEVVAMAAGVCAMVWALWRRHWAEAVFIGLQVVAFGTSFWYMSVNRAVLVWFPLWAMLGGAVAGRPKSPGWRAVVIVAVAISATLMLVWAWLFFTGRWAS